MSPCLVSIQAKTFIETSYELTVSYPDLFSLSHLTPGFSIDLGQGLGAGIGAKLGLDSKRGLVVPLDLVPLFFYLAY